MTTVHLMRWSAAMENFHRIHYDPAFAVGHEGLPALILAGSWKQHFLARMMCDWLAPTGWLAKISFQFRQVDVVGSTLTAWGRVTDTYEHEGLGVILCEIGIRNQEGQESSPGIATGVLPLGEDEQHHVPYPFPGLPE